MSLGRQYGLFFLFFGALFSGIPLFMLSVKPYQEHNAPELLWICIAIGATAFIAGIYLLLPRRPSAVPAAFATEPQGLSAPGMVLFSLPLVVLGGLTIAQALGLGDYIGGGEKLVTDSVLALVGLVFLLPGILILLYGLGVRRRGGGVLVAFSVLAFAAVFHYGVFAEDLRSWTGGGFGPLSAGELARVVVVAIDLYVLFVWVAVRTTFIGGQPGPIWKRLDGMDPLRRKMAVAGMLLLPAGVAVLLHFTRVLDWIGAVFGQ